jgi:NitT/TauT family transport system substrate-binding protein
MKGIVATGRIGAVVPAGRRAVLRGLIALAASAFAALPAGAATKLTIAHGIAADFLPVLVAKDRGLFEKHGLDVTLQPVAMAVNVTAMLVSGSADIAASTPLVTLQAREAGIDIVAVAGDTRIQKGNPTSSLVTRKGVTVAKAADLIGKKIGVPGLNSGNHLLLEKWLLDNGVALDKVTFVEAGLPQMGDMLKSGTVDAVVINEPLRSRIVQGGNGDYSVAFASELNPDLVGIFWIARADWTKANPETLAAFRASLTDAIALIASDPAVARAVEKRAIGFNGPRWPAFDTRLTPDDMAFYAAMGHQLGLLKGQTDVAAAIAK